MWTTLKVFSHPVDNCQVEGHTKENKQLCFFTLADNVKEWYENIKLHNITFWDKMKSAFLKEFPIHLYLFKSGMT